jgi:hypothetical protein
MLHEARTDLCLWLGLLYLLIAGAGSWSLDGWRIARSTGSGGGQKAATPDQEQPKTQ